MDLLVLGANGLLGSNVVAQASSRGRAVTAAYHTEESSLDAETVRLDITDAERFEDLCVEVAPAAIVNCAAMTDVDGCEAQPEQVDEVNGHAPEWLAGVAAQQELPFVHVSTDYVFDGRSHGRYQENDETTPVQAYGASKLLGEQTVSKAHPSPLIPRLSFVYGRHAGTGDLDGFPAWVRSRLHAGETVPAFVDQHVTPTRAGQAAAVILDLLDAGESGLVHVACRDCVTPHDVATSVAQFDGVSTDRVQKGHMADVDRPATRPAHTCLDVGRVERLLGRPQPTLDDDLRAVL